MDPLMIAAGWLLLCALPASLLSRHLHPGEGRFVFLTLLSGPIGIAAWAFGRAVERLEARAIRHH